MLRHMMLAMVAGTMAAACSQPTATPAEGGFLGVTSGEGSNFTSPADGCTYSFLFDTFTVPRNPASTEELLMQTRTFSLNAPAHAAGAPVNVDVRGILLGGGATATLEVAFGETTQSFPLAASENAAFEQRITGPAVAGANVLRVSATLTPGSEPGAQLNIESIDVAMNQERFCVPTPE